MLSKVSSVITNVVLLPLVCFAVDSFWLVEFSVITAVLGVRRSCKTSDIVMVIFAAAGRVFSFHCCYLSDIALLMPV
jgi:hypothetical protein